MTLLPLDFPPLVALATAAAEEYRAIEVEHFDGYAEPWTLMSGSRQRFAIQCQARLLSDLTRPASRDAWLRWLSDTIWVSRKHRYECPGFDFQGGMWILKASGYRLEFYAETREDPPSYWMVIPDLDISGPEAWPVALRQVILAVGVAR